MKRIYTYVLTALVAALMVGCGGGGGGGGSAPAAPTGGVSAVAGDTTVTLNWNVDGSITYWVWGIISNTINILGCSSCATYTNSAGSPFVVTGVNPGGWLYSGTQAAGTYLINNSTYTFTVNGRVGSSPGSPAASSVTVTPRLAGGAGTWVAGSTVTGTPNLTSLDYGAPVTVLTASSTLGSSGMFVASDFTGTMWWTTTTATSGTYNSSTDGLFGTWMQGTATGGQINAVAYNGGYFVAVGNTGKIWRSIDGMGWTLQTPPGGYVSNLNAIVKNGSTEFVAVAADGTAIYSSSSGTVWAKAATTNAGGNALNAVANSGSLFVAVGANGTVISSSDANTWTAHVPANTTAPGLVGVAYGAPVMAFVQTNYPTTTVATPSPVWVAVGSGGELVTSPDGATWTQQLAGPVPVGGHTLTNLTYGHQFVAIDNAGNAYTSVSGVASTWTSAATGAGVSLSAIKPITLTGSGGSNGQLAGQFLYGAVGNTGVTVISR